MRCKVVDRKRRELNNVEFQADIGQRLHRPINLVSLHREQTNFGVERESVDFLPATHLLEVPDHFVQIERNLLLRLVTHDLWDLLGVDWRRFEKPPQTGLARHRHRDR